MKEKVMDILMDLRPDVDFENEKKLIGDGFWSLLILCLWWQNLRMSLM